MEKVKMHYRVRHHQPHGTFPRRRYQAGDDGQGDCGCSSMDGNLDLLPQVLLGNVAHLVHGGDRLASHGNDLVTHLESSCLSWRTLIDLQHLHLTEIGCSREAEHNTEDNYSEQQVHGWSS